LKEQDKKAKELTIKQLKLC